MITENTKAILLLTSFFNANEIKEYKTLTVNEYGYFACWLHQNGYKPVDLLNEGNFNDIWASWDEPSSHIKAKKVIDFARLENTIAKLTYERIKNLLNRGASLSLALDKWQSAGIWIMDRKHEHYPKAFKKQLKHQSPALFFGVGSPELLSKQAVGFVGSRDCDVQDEQATNQYVSHYNQINYQVVSGAAKGVDSHAMLASLNNGNTAIGIMADSLFRASASRQWRQHIKANKLVLISPFFPEGRFTPANAMARNKFIYLLSSATVVVTSGEKGGTWEGAKENLKKNWVPLFVSAHKQPLQAGNQALLNGDSLGKVQAKASSIYPNDTTEQLLALFSTPVKTISAEEMPQQSKVEANETVSSDVNTTGFLLNDKDTSPSNVSYTESTIGNFQTQGDLFSIAENATETEQESEKIPGLRVIPDETYQLENTEVAPRFVESEIVESNIVENDIAENNELKTTNTFPGIEEQSHIGTKLQLVDEIEPSQVNEPVTEKVVAQQKQQPLTEQSLAESVQQSTTPLLDSFYQQLCELITKHPQRIIEKTTLDSYFPEFEIMGKQALDKWLKHLVEQGKLVRPSSKKKQFTLPLISPTQLTELVTKSDSETN